MRGSGVALVVAVALAAAPVRAQDDVHALLGEAVTEYDAGHYEEAYALFSRAHATSPSARTERALGKAAFDLRRYAEAMRWLEASLTDERTPLTDEMRAEVEALIVRARAFVGRYALAPNVEGASLDVDGAPTADRTIQLDMGEHQIHAAAEGYDPITRRLVVHGGEDETIELTLTAVRTTPEPTAPIIVTVPAPAPPPPPRDGDGPLRTLGWTGYALGLGATSIALGLSIARGALIADYAQQCPGGGASSQTCNDYWNQGHTVETTAYAFGISGVVIGVAGTVLATGLTRGRDGTWRALGWAIFGAGIEVLLYAAGLTPFHQVISTDPTQSLSSRVWDNDSIVPAMWTAWISGAALAIGGATLGIVSSGGDDGVSSVRLACHPTTSGIGCEGSF